MGKESNNPIYGISAKPFYERKWFAEFWGAAPPFLAAAVGAYKAYSEKLGPWIWGSALVGCVLLVFVGVLKTYLGKKQDASDDEARSHEGLTAALHVLHSTVAHAGELSAGEKDECLRVTFHRVVPPLDNSDEIEQIVPYVGGKFNGVGRTFHIRAGITGRAIREGAVLLMDRQSDSFEDYKKQLVRDWGYTPSDAEKFTSDRYSLMAVPVTDKGGKQVLGVIYLDCSKRNFFATEAVQTAVISGCAGVTRYTGERYA